MSKLKRFKRYETEDGKHTLRILDVKEHCVLAVEPETEAFYHVYGVKCMDDGHVTWEYRQRLAPETIQFDDIYL